MKLGGSLDSNEYKIAVLNNIDKSAVLNEEVAYSEREQDCNHGLQEKSMLQEG